MERFSHSLKVFWRSERLIRQNELRLTTQKIQFNALAGIVAVFGLVMLSIAVFFALVPYWGQAWAAAAVGGADLLIAIILISYASSLKPAPELEMIREMREFAIADLQDEVVKAENELVDLRNDVKRFVRIPVAALMPGLIGPLLGSVTRGLKSKKN